LPPSADVAAGGATKAGAQLQKGGAGPLRFCQGRGAPLPWDRALQPL